MTIFNLGSINLDHFYTSAHLPVPGETMFASTYSQGLGGKGANQSVAIGKSGAAVFHIGQIGRNDEAHLSLLKEANVNLHFVRPCDDATGHAIVMIDEVSAENQILIIQGVNITITSQHIHDALADAGTGDWALTQNETNGTEEFLKLAKDKGLKLCYSAAPFDKDKLLSVIDMIDLLVVNEIEAAEISSALGGSPESWPVPNVIVTKGKDGADYFGAEGQFHQPAEPVNAIDSTGAGDTYLGFLLGRLSLGESMKQAMTLAGKAAGIQVTRLGTASAIPDLSELQLDKG